MKWYSQPDQLTLDVSDLNFAKRQRGRKPSQFDNVIPTKLTRRHCVSKVGEVFDIIGKITPITATLKLDLHTLILRKLDWDDQLPDDLRSLWTSHFQMMQEINDITFKRAVIPPDAINLEVETIDTGDASHSLACAAIYARYTRQNGEHSCQLIFSRSKLIPDHTSQPRAELLAALLNTHTGEVVRRSLMKHHKRAIKLCDSQIALHWINSNDLPLKQWVRNRVLEIRRHTNLQDWFYVRSKDMIADIGTRRVTNLGDVNQDSTWINGFSWMKQDISNFPMHPIKEIKLEGEDISSASKESTPQHHQVFKSSLMENDVKQLKERYNFSKYIIDPNRHRFRDIIRITAIIFRFIRCLKTKRQSRAANTIESKQPAIQKIQLQPISLSEKEIQDAEDYFFRKTTQEVKRFTKDSKYSKITMEKDGILYFTGRILPTEITSTAGSMTRVMKDLSSTTFMVPVIDQHSPVAYSLVNEIHWFDAYAKHSGVETVHRYTMKKAYIIEGRQLIKNVSKSCERCRYLRKKTIDISMGPISSHELNIAPAFHTTQVDLAGPFNSYSNHNKRTTVKVWLAIFLCTTTSTTNIKIMDDYSTEAFIMAFIRFSCEVGYPKTLLPDEGSQLIKGCETMRLNFKDIKHQLHLNHHVHFETCPVGAHFMHGKVERKIREIKKSIEKSVTNNRLSILQWETLSSQIANAINDQPLALGNIVSDFETMDLITPNRLKLGRNNDRSPIGAMITATNTRNIIDDNQKIFDTWFDNWLIAHVPKLVQQPKWFRSDQDLKAGDIVLFLKNDSAIASTYQYGIISSNEESRDGKVRKAKVRYRNSNENKDRETNRATRDLVVIHHADELNITQSINEAAIANFCKSGSVKLIKQ